MDKALDPPDRDTPWLIFDGDCAFCTSSAGWVAERLRRPGGPNARLVPWQCTDLESLGTTAERARREVLWLTPEGSIYGGATAFAEWLRYRGNPYAMLGRMISWPLFSQLAAAVYRLVARNRQRMPGGTAACALPPSTFDPAEPGTKPL